MFRLGICPKSALPMGVRPSRPHLTQCLIEPQTCTCKMASKSVKLFESGSGSTNVRQTTHPATEKCVGIGGIACTARAISMINIHVHDVCSKFASCLLPRACKRDITCVCMLQASATRSTHTTRYSRSAPRSSTTMSRWLSWPSSTAAYSSPFDVDQSSRSGRTRRWWLAADGPRRRTRALEQGHHGDCWTTATRT